MKEYRYKSRGVCADQILIEIDHEECVRKIEFTGGCSGNRCGIRLKKIAGKSIGRPAAEVAARYRGRLCGGKETSCEDQMAKALLEALSR